MVRTWRRAPPENGRRLGGRNAAEPPREKRRGPRGSESAGGPRPKSGAGPRGQKAAEAPAPMRGMPPPQCGGVPCGPKAVGAPGGPKATKAPSPHPQGSKWSESGGGRDAPTVAVASTTLGQRPRLLWYPWGRHRFEVLLRRFRTACPPPPPASFGAGASASIGPSRPPLLWASGLRHIWTTGPPPSLGRGSSATFKTPLSDHQGARCFRAASCAAFRPLGHPPLQGGVSINLGPPGHPPLWGGGLQCFLDH